MSIIKEEYLSLLPKGRCIRDVVVLSQAWKKSQAFIRKHNWYADVLELDASAVNLEEQLALWAEALENDDFRTEALRLVPAPKNAKWDFYDVSRSAEEVLDSSIEDLGGPHFDDWRPKAATEKDDFLDDDTLGNDDLKLRPLAHIAIRDQTFATAVMMCLAEAIESAQGNTSETGPDGAPSRRVVSFGNRLQCTWRTTAEGRAEARYSWGNAKTYRQYFQDYRIFLARPPRVCAELASRLSSRRELFVVSLDIKSFFDRIDRKALLAELKFLEEEHQRRRGLPDELTSDAEFWEYTERILRWRWLTQEHDQAELFGGSGAERLQLGLPQGLVAAGFFANAYLVRFDRTMHEFAQAGEHLGSDTEQNDIVIRDYCRYVDDMRLVVEAQGGLDAKSLLEVKEDVEAYVNRVLRKHCQVLGTRRILELSQQKSEVKPYRTMSAQSHMSALMEMLNAEVSGTFDSQSLAQAAGGLDGLLWMSDQIDDEAEHKPSRMALATVAVPNTDVRDDTVKRFVATRLAQVLRHRLAMTDSVALVGKDESFSDQVTNGQLLAHEFESTARKLVKRWAENPALALLLRCGLDLFPHPRLLSPVIEALSVKLFSLSGGWNLDRRREVKAAEYVAADLMRAGAVETGFRRAEEYPEGVDVPGYREELAAFARRVLVRPNGSPWYLCQQAMLYLASVGDFASFENIAEADPQIEPYLRLQQVAQYKTVGVKEVQSALPYALVAQQLHPNVRRFSSWLTDVLRDADRALKSKVVQVACLNRPDLMLTAAKARSASIWRSHVPRSLAEANRTAGGSVRLNDGVTTAVPLLLVTAQAENPFRQENGILMLAMSLLRVSAIEQFLATGLSVADISLTCKEWSRLHALPNDVDFLEAHVSSMPNSIDPLCSKPGWVADDRAWLYGLGRILRSALTGEADFTARRYLVTEDVGRYSGLRSTWYLRRFGLMNSGLGLLDEPGPVTPWLSGFLSSLLQWPGVDFRADGADEIAKVKTSADLLAYVEKRMKGQRALYGPRSRTPMYVVPVDDHRPLEERPLRVAIVQPMRPRLEEFDTKDPTHWTSGALAEHQGHLAEVCRLAHQKLKTWASANSAPFLADHDSPIVDLVLFPELAVHPEHIFLLRRLSDQLRANIFAGLTFIESANAGGVVNQGLWLIRTESESHGRTFQYVWQGKRHPMKLEARMGIKGYRPHITLVELPIGGKTRTRVAAAICFDATDLDLVADLRDRSDMFLVAALNQDVQTFDNMVAALHFHMYQPVVLANSGEFGGSTAQVPLPKHDRLIAHVHGNRQVAVSVFEVEPSLFKSTTSPKAPKEPKSPPAGYRGRPIS